MILGIVQQHHGYVRVESARGRGTTFEVWLPSVSAQASTEVAADVVVRSAKHADSVVLVVEDDEGVRRFIEQALRESEVQLLVAKSPSQALELTSKRVPTPSLPISSCLR
jgi:PleD family two-component response regulator